MSPQPATECTFVSAGPSDADQSTAPFLRIERDDSVVLRRRHDAVAVDQHLPPHGTAEVG